MTRHDDDEKELQVLLRNVSAVVLLILFSLIVLVALLAPFFKAQLDTTLILGLSAAIMGALPVMLGVQLALRKRDDDK